MSDAADRFLPFWVKDPLPSYTLDELPIWFDPDHAGLWTSLIYKGFDQGWWVTCDPFPEIIANSLKSQFEDLEAGKSLKLANMIGPSSLLERFHKTEDLRFQYRDLRTFISFLPDQKAFDFEFHLEEISVAIRAERWISSRTHHGPRPAGEPGPKWILRTIPPESHKLYWLAEVRMSASTTLAILETSGHVDLSYSDSVYVMVYGRQEQLHLPVAAIMLDHNWPRLPTVIALARVDRRYFQAYRAPQQEPMAMALKDQIDGADPII